MASVALEGVSKIYPDGVNAVRGMDLEVHDREFLVLLGPSGCGKTTTLRLIAGLEKATTGEIRVGGSTVGHLPPKDRNIAMVFQNDALYPHVTVYKNMAYGLELRYGGGWIGRTWRRLTTPTAAAACAAARRGIDAQVRRTAALLGIEPLLDRWPRQLSRGERQRVALGRAMVRQPAAFLLDEPLSNLDAPLRSEMRRELRELHRRLQSTMVYVTHDQTEAMTLGDRIAVMHCGEIQQIGEPMEVYDRPQNRFVASFIGSPPMNFVRGRIQGQGAEVCFVSAGDGLRVTQPLPQETGKDVGRVELGVRPEDIGVAARGEQSAQTRGVVSVVESLGDHTLIAVEINCPNTAEGNDQQRLICKTDPRTEVRAGDHVELTIDVQRTHLFDGRSGKNLTLQDRSSPRSSTGSRGRCETT
ncbi:MAG: ABC transporter ATP-binding protein [Pirellulaceae bacterium]